MAYQVTDADVAQYVRDGYVVFRQIVPAALVRDLRRECDKAAAIAHEIKDANAQRLQPLAKFADRIDLKPFTEWGQLPDVRTALQTVLSPRHTYGDLTIAGVLLNPTHEPYCTQWHRDITLETSRLSAEEFGHFMTDLDAVNQINCPLYDDDCTWFVPGSHFRARDTAGETAARLRRTVKEVRANSPVTDVVEKERLCLDYTQGMPGAVQLHLNAGDFALYRPLGWHIGNYVPYRKRATLHDLSGTPRYAAWFKEWIAGGSPRWALGVEDVAAKPVAAGEAYVRPG